MTKLACKAPDARALRVMSGQLRVLGKANEFLYNVELDLLDDRVTANGWRYERLEMHRPLFAGVPILIAYTNGGTRIGDGHNYRMKRTKDGREYASFTDAASERIIGTLSDDEADIRTEVRDGHTWIVGKGTIWAWYAAEAVDKIARQGRMDVSIETLVSQSRMEGKEEVEETYLPLGATILGDGVSPAVAGANIRPLSAINLKELKLRAASYMEKAEAEGQKGTKKGVRQMNKAKRMRELEALFPNERVFCVSDDGLTACLCNERTGDIRAHRFEADAPNTVVDARFTDVNAVVNFTVGDTEMTMEAGALLGMLQGQLSALGTKLEKATGDLEACRQALSNMKENEKARRRAAAKAAVRRALAEINRVQEAKDEPVVDEKVCEDVDEDIDEGEYDEQENADGAWCGDEKACAAVKAACMDAIRKASEDALAKKRRVNAWDGLGIGESDGETNVFDLLK